MSRASRAFIIAAAGSGSRLGGVPKQFRELGDAPVWEWSLRAADALFRRGELDEAVVIFPQEGDYELPGRYSVPVRAVRGGDERSDSVRAGLGAASSEIALIHDAARPFVSGELCVRAAEAAERAGAALPLIPSTDSLKELREGAPRALDRSRILRAQTPQAFRREELISVMEGAGTATDEASLWTAAGREIAVVEGEEANFKITTEFDWLAARALAERGRETRTGLGYDVHRLAQGRRLILGGVGIESPLGLLGHSDADLLCHAVSDALLGAAGLGDIGMLFPASDEQYRGADSAALLAEVIRLVRADGWRPVWIDAAVSAQAPRLAPYIPMIKERLEAVLAGCGAPCGVNVKAKSGEGVGSVGRGECFECRAVATIERYSIGG